ncbi:MAG: tetratricopeptide repeat protein [Deltaproteobacteria bacterium]|nr:tetratricopeptide repeat protein [Deltaproteobacteria bacterium]MBW1848199.1 tetratricopeptide repeat protein [Deltaproteobacteria bacterium]
MLNNSLLIKYSNRIIICIVILYSTTFVGWANYFDLYFDSNYALLDYENRITNIIVLLVLNLILMSSLTVAIKYIANKLFKIDKPFREIMSIVIGLLLISIFIMVLQIYVFVIFNNIVPLDYIGWFGYILQAIWSTVSLKKLFKVTFLRTIIILANCFLVLIIIIIIAFGAIDFIYLKDFKEVGQLYSSKKLFESNVKKYKTAIKNNPNKIKYHYFLAETYRNYVNAEEYIKHGELFNRRAEIEYKKALSINPDFLKAKVGLGNIYVRQKNYKSALAIFKEIALKEPENEYVNMNLGKIYLELNNKEKANKYFNKN